jgi:tRNA(Ile)-lysidine synthase
VTQALLFDRFASVLQGLLAPHCPKDIGLAVSGGGDSMAMLGLCHNWANQTGVHLHVVTIDHGLRRHSSQEAAMVAAESARLGHAHTTLTWHWDQTGNIHDQARKARLRLIDQWRGAIDHVLFAHTQNDVAETILMRLARGSGVDGLAAMAQKRHIPSANAAGRGFTILRPLLGETRADLRHYVQAMRIAFVDDPSNDDPQFERARIRQIMPRLAEIGLTPQALAQSAGRIARTRDTVAGYAARACDRIIVQDRTETGHLVFDRSAFDQLDQDIQMRLLSAACRWISATPYGPRHAALHRVRAALQPGLKSGPQSGQGGTLHGMHIIQTDRHIRLFREFSAVKHQSCAAIPGAIWDGVWRLNQGMEPGAQIRALGPEGWAQIPQKPVDSPGFRASLSLPALYKGARLIACSALNFGPEGIFTLCRAAPSFAAFLQLR